MHRDCTHCRCPLTTDAFVREASENMEAERKAAGLEGIRFVYYHCAGCAADSIFVDILPRDGELVEDYEGRRGAMEAVVRGMHAGAVAAVVVPVKEP